jgi:hypothetical protein
MAPTRRPTRHFSQVRNICIYDDDSDAIHSRIILQYTVHTRISLFFFVFTLLSSLSQHNTRHDTDGAAMSLLMSEEKALELGYKPLAYLRDWSFRACDPWEELLLGPTYCTSEILQRNKMALSDIGVLEIHEGMCLFVSLITWLIAYVLDCLIACLGMTT